MHCLDLLVPFSAGLVESFVLLLDQADFAFDFLVPLGVGILLAFLILLFELADL